MAGSSRIWRVGLVGAGNVALGMHVPGFLGLPDRYRVVGVADPVEARREMARQALGLPPTAAYSDHQDLLRREGLDLVDVTTPPHVRQGIVSAALEAGCHVLAEKPLATVPADAAAMVEAAQRRGLLLAMVHNYLFFPENRLVRQWIDEGRIGQVRLAILNFLGVIDGPSAPQWSPRWRHDPLAGGGGVLMDMLHALYLAELYLGGPAQAVNATVDRQWGSPDEVEGLALCRLEFADGYALVNVGWGAGPGGAAVMGTEGRILVQHRREGTCPWEPVRQVTLINGAGVQVRRPPGRQGSFRHLLLDLSQALAEARPARASGADGLRAVEAVLAAYASAALERTVGLPLGRDDPLFRLGLAGLREVPLPPTSPLRRRGLFGLSPTAAAALS